MKIENKKNRSDVFYHILYVLILIFLIITCNITMYYIVYLIWFQNIQIEIINLFLPILIPFFTVTFLGGVFEQKKYKETVSRLFKSSMLFLTSIISLIFAIVGFEYNIFQISDIFIIILKIFSSIGIILFFVGIVLLYTYFSFGYIEKHRKNRELK